MGGAPKYSKGRATLKRWQDAIRYKESQNIMVKQGKGRYPKCLKQRPYPEVCPEEEPKDIQNVPDECRLCPEYLESNFHLEHSHEERLKRLKEAGLPTVIESKVK